MNGNRWKAWILAAAILVLGIALGASTTMWWGTRVLRRALHAPVDAPGLADRAAARIGADLTEELHLTAEEAARVQSILDESAANLKTVRARAGAEAAQELRRSTQEIAAALPAAKRAELYRVLSRRFERLGLKSPAP